MPGTEFEKINEENVEESIIEQNEILNQSSQN